MIRNRRTLSACRTLSASAREACGVPILQENLRDLAAELNPQRRVIQISAKSIEDGVLKRGKRIQRIFPKRRIFQALDDHRYEAVFTKIAKRTHGLAHDVDVIVSEQFCKLRLKIVRQDANRVGRRRVWRIRLSLRNLPP